MKLIRQGEHQFCFNFAFYLPYLFRSRSFQTGFSNAYFYDASDSVLQLLQAAQPRQIVCCAFLCCLLCSFAVSRIAIYRMKGKRLSVVRSAVFCSEFEWAKNFGNAVSDKTVRAVVFSRSTERNGKRNLYACKSLAF